MNPMLYACGEIPMLGDMIVLADEAWIVTLICYDRLRAKCERASRRTQVFYIAKVNLMKRKAPEA